ncbi:hypothetical protein ISCGN_000955 [Ixodes scapularis]
MAEGIKAGSKGSANFMRQFRDKKTRELKNLTASQFMDVWSHYDKDGKQRCARLRARRPLPGRMTAHVLRTLRGRLATSAVQEAPRRLAPLFFASRAHSPSVSGIARPWNSAPAPRRPPG